MKKILCLLTALLGLASFQISAATLTWIDTPGNGNAVEQTDEELFGDYQNKVPKGAINDNWVFNIDGSERIELNVTEFLNRDFNIAVRLDGNLINFSQAGNIGSWDYLDFVSAGNHTINILGNVLTKAEIDIRVAGIENPNPIPVPAAVWLFGSGLLGLMGFKGRRKLAV